MFDVWQESPEILRRFLLYVQTVKGQSSKTINEYFLDLRIFFRYMKIKKQKCQSDIEFEKIKINDIDLEFLKDIGTVDIFEYMNYLIQVRNNNSSARSRKVASLKSFFKYITIKTNLLSKNPMEAVDSPKLGKTLPRYMTFNECLKFLDSIKKYGNKNKERDYAIATFFLNCGMRLSELVGINFDDIGGDHSLRILGKGNKERVLYLNNSCLEALEEYKKVRGESKDKNAVFLSRNKKRISVKTVQFLMKKYFTLAGLSHKKLSTHKLRHTAATLMYCNGVDIRVLKDILGHKSISLTQIYTHTNPQSIKHAFDNNPLCKNNIRNSENILETSDVDKK